MRAHPPTGGALHCGWQFNNSPTPAERCTPLHANRRDARVCYPSWRDDKRVIDNRFNEGYTPIRKHPPHLLSLERPATILLLTVCTKNRKRILACHEMHRLLKAAWDSHDVASIQMSRAATFCRRRRMVELPRGMQAPPIGWWTTSGEKKLPARIVLNRLPSLHTANQSL
jgi:hypothetical protein